MDEGALAELTAQQLVLDADPGRRASPPPKENTPRPLTALAASPRPGAVPGGFAGANERTKQMATTKLPPSLQAKLAANARRSANPAASPSGSVLNAGQRLDASLLNRAPMPSIGASRAPAARPNRPALRLSEMGAGARPGVAASDRQGAAAARPKPQLGTLPAAASAADSPFSNFSKIVDPSGRLNFDGKAILHASGVEFGNGTSFKITMEDLDLQEQLGFGNYGTVSRVLHTRTKVEMAMKEIRLELDQAKLNAILMELDILHRAIAPQIVEFYGAFFVESCVYYCMEYMDVGSLEKVCMGRTCVIPEPVLARIARNTVEGLSFLKDELQIIHRDVKPTNILVNSHGEVKLCDFGVSGQLEKSLAKTNIGCQSYMAPERIRSEGRDLHTYTTASDVWSLGLSLVEVVSGVYPYPPETFTNVFAQLQAIVDGDAPTLPYPSTEPVFVTSAAGVRTELERGTCTYSDAARDFIAQCLRKIPRQRPSYAELLAHPLLAQGALASPADMRTWVAEAAAAQQARRAALQAA